MMIWLLKPDANRHRSPSECPDPVLKAPVIAQAHSLVTVNSFLILAVWTCRTTSMSIQRLWKARWSKSPSAS